MRIASLIAGAIVSAVAITAAFAESAYNYSRAPSRRYLPEYIELGDLILPKNCNKWVYVGSPRSIFAEKLSGAGVTVKNIKRYVASGGWGLLQLQSPRTVGSSQVAAQIRMRLLSHRERQERRLT
ncbi:hypothetical protein ACC761_36240 [Rhizobium ruizarguesonis]